MSTTKRRFEFTGPENDIGTFLRTLADTLESEQSVIQGYDIDITNFRKLKITLQKNADHMSVKLKIKSLLTDEEIEFDDSEEYAYAHLKKRMKAYYKELEENLDAGLVPSREIVSVFVQDAQTMVTYPDRGQEHYDDFSRACRDFKEAFEAEDMSMMKKIFARIEALKDRCHDTYK